MSGWILIIFLLLLGGLISTLGDLLGTKIGKARFSILKLRPKRTAILITIITGSLISASSLSLMILVNRQLRVGLFKLGDLQRKLQESRQELVPLKQERKELENELKQLERNLIALRSGQVVIRSGQSLIMSEINVERNNIDLLIENILKKANLIALNIVQPSNTEQKNLIRYRKDHIDALKKRINQGGDWVINIKSVGNVLKGENYLYIFPELVLNQLIVSKGETISSITLSPAEFTNQQITNKISQLLASTLAEAKSRGSLVNEIKYRQDYLRELQEFLNKNQKSDIFLEAVSLRKSETADPLIVEINIKQLDP